MAFLIFLIILTGLLHREILCVVIHFTAQTKMMEPGTWDVRISARVKRRIQIYKMQEPPLEALSVETFLSTIIFVSDSLWDSWANEDKEAYLEWVHSTHLRSSVFQRLIFGFNPEPSDRDVALFSSTPLAFVSCLEKAAAARSTMHLSFIGSWLTGLSLLGPSILSDWPEISFRLKSFTNKLEKLS
jgi:hypothetical protein